MIVRDVEEDCLIICNEVTFIVVFYFCPNDHHLVVFFCQVNCKLMVWVPFSCFQFCKQSFLMLKGFSFFRQHWFKLIMKYDSLFCGDFKMNRLRKQIELDLETYSIFWPSSWYTMCNCNLPMNPYFERIAESLLDYCLLRRYFL